MDNDQHNIGRPISNQPLPHAFRKVLGIISNQPLPHAFRKVLAIISNQPLPQAFRKVLGTNVMPQEVISHF
jgi:hypothetical protein